MNSPPAVALSPEHTHAQSAASPFACMTNKNGSPMKLSVRLTETLPEEENAPNDDPPAPESPQCIDSQAPPDVEDADDEEGPRSPTAVFRTGLTNGANVGYKRATAEYADADADEETEALHRTAAMAVIRESGFYSGGTPASARRRVRPVSAGRRSTPTHSAVAGGATQPRRVTPTSTRAPTTTPHGLFSPPYSSTATRSLAISPVPSLRASPVVSRQPSADLDTVAEEEEELAAPAVSAAVMNDIAQLFEVDEASRGFEEMALDEAARGGDAAQQLTPNASPTRAIVPVTVAHQAAAPPAQPYDVVEPGDDQDGEVPRAPERSLSPHKIGRDMDSVLRKMVMKHFSIPLCASTKYTDPADTQKPSKRVDAFQPPIIAALIAEFHNRSEIMNRMRVVKADDDKAYRIFSYDESSGMWSDSNTAPAEKYVRKLLFNIPMVVPPTHPLAVELGGKVMNSLFNQADYRMLFKDGTFKSIIKKLADQDDVGPLISINAHEKHLVFDKPDDLLAFAGGFAVNVTSGERIVRLEPGHFKTMHIPYKYVPGSHGLPEAQDRRDAVDLFVRQMFPIDEERAAAIERFAYCTVTNKKDGKYFIVLTDKQGGGNMKTTWMHALMNCLGGVEGGDTSLAISGHCDFLTESKQAGNGISSHNANEFRYAGKLLAFFDETNPDRELCENRIKQYANGDHVVSGRDAYEKGGSFVWRALIVISCNENNFPIMRSDSEALMNRMIVMPARAKVVPRIDERDPLLMGRLRAVYPHFVFKDVDVCDYVKNECRQEFLDLLVDVNRAREARGGAFLPIPESWIDARRDLFHKSTVFFRALSEVVYENYVFTDPEFTTTVDDALNKGLKFRMDDIDEDGNVTVAEPLRISNKVTREHIFNRFYKIRDNARRFKARFPISAFTEPLKVIACDNGARYAAKSGSDRHIIRGMRSIDRE